MSIPTDDFAKLRACVATLPIGDDVKRTWLKIIGNAEKWPQTEANIRQMIERSERAKERAQTLSLAQMFSAFTAGMAFGAAIILAI